MQIEGQREVTDALRSMQRFADSVRSQGLLRLAEAIRKSTHERIAVTKRSPDGEAWRPWSPGYAATRARDKSLLIDSRALLTTLAVREDGSEILVGSPRPYAPHVQRSRPFLGVGQGEVDALQRSLDTWAEGELRKVMGGARGGV
jgi:hypothetical protein